MSQFLAAMGPIVLFWTLPLVPMFYAAIAATLETVTKPLRRVRQVSPNPGTAIANDRAFSAQQESIATNESGA
jgi:hypothetical protein